MKRDFLNNSTTARGSTVSVGPNLILSRLATWVDLLQVHSVVCQHVVQITKRTLQRINEGGVIIFLSADLLQNRLGASINPG